MKFLEAAGSLSLSLSVFVCFSHGGNLVSCLLYQFSSLLIRFISYIKKEAAFSIADLVSC